MAATRFLQLLCSLHFLTLRHGAMRHTAGCEKHNAHGYIPYPDSASHPADRRRRRTRAQMLREYLEPAHFQLALAHTCEQGLHLASQQDFDLLLLDLMLPDGNGLDLLKQYRQRSRRPVIMFTAHGGETDRVLGLEFGADDYLTKPFSPRELKARITAVLRRFDEIPEAAPPGLAVGALSLTRLPAGPPGRRRGGADRRRAAHPGNPDAHGRQVVARDQIGMYALGRVPDRYDRSIDTHQQPASQAATGQRRRARHPQSARAGLRARRRVTMPLLPVRSLFWRAFLTFWSAMALILVCGMLFTAAVAWYRVNSLDGLNPGSLAHDAAQIAREDGADGLERWVAAMDARYSALNIYLVDASDHDILGRALRAPARLAQDYRAAPPDPFPPRPRRRPACACPGGIRSC